MRNKEKRTKRVLAIKRQQPYYICISLQAFAEMARSNAWIPPLITLLIHLSATTTDVEQLDNRKALFTEEGTLILTNSYAHLHLRYKIPRLREHITAIMLVRTQLEDIKISSTWPPNLNERQRDRLSQRLLFVRRYVAATTSDVATRINSILIGVNADAVSLDPADYKDHIISKIAQADRNRKGSRPRNRRQIITAGIGLVAGLIGSSISSLFNPDTLYDIIEKKQSVISHQVADNILSINANTNELKQLNKTVTSLAQNLLAQMYSQESLELETTLLTITTTVGILSNNLHHVSNSIQRAQGGKLALDAVDATGLQENLDELKRKVTLKGYRMTTQDISDLDNVKTSYLVDKDSSNLNLILHLPIYIPKQELTLHRYLPTPILMADNLPSAPTVYLTLKTTQTYIGLDMARTTFVELSPEDLALCLHRDKTFFCPHLSRLKDKAPSCIFALFTNNKSRIPKLCGATYTTTEFKLTRISMQSWLITSTINERVFITCPGNQPLEYQLQGSYILTLDKGCTATSNSFHIERPLYEADTAYNSSFTETSPVIDPAIFTVLTNITSTDVNSILGHSNDTQTTADPSHILRYKEFTQKLEKIAESVSPLNLTHLLAHGSSSTLLTIIIIAITLAVTLMIYWKCKNKNNTTQGMETTYWFNRRDTITPQNQTRRQPVVRLNTIPREEEDDPEVNPPQPRNMPPTPINQRRQDQTIPPASPTSANSGPAMTSTQNLQPLFAAQAANAAATPISPEPAKRNTASRYDVPPTPQPVANRYDVPPTPQLAFKPEPKETNANTETLLPRVLRPFLPDNQPH